MLIAATCVGIEVSPPGDAEPRTIIHLHAAESNTRFSTDGLTWSPLLRIERRDPGAASRYTIGAAYALELEAAAAPESR